MWCMMAELRFTGIRGNERNPFAYTNNGKISFTEYEWKKQGLGASATYLKARNQLIKVGLIRITYQGGMARGDMNKYDLLFIEGVKHEEMRWKRYPDEDWEHEIPKVKDFIIGRGTRFKKKNNTLVNKTLNGTNPPKELYPSLDPPLRK